jgi:SsrA-binding protein
MGNDVVATNRRAKHDFAILETFEVGIELKGTEVKSLRAHKASLSDSFARGTAGELFLYNMYISPYEYGSYTNVDSKRRRKLLAHKSQIKKLTGCTSQKGMTLVPLKVYFKHGKAKLELALAKGKRQYDKREAIKKREAKREVERHFRGRTKA